jgi:DMSO/TMAO reductase YedYZ molybdopterin-dependent catalytic subunit
MGCAALEARKLGVIAEESPLVTMISRRDFLAGIPWTALGAAEVSPLLAWAGDESQTRLAGENGLIVRSLRFLDLETPVEYFDTWLTPVPRFFVRNHMHEPVTLDPQEWKLAIGGEVEHPFALDLSELSKLGVHSVVNTLECAGNGRGLYQPAVPGVQWQKGAVGTARFSGPRLRTLLERAGVKPSGKHVMFHGLDEVPGKVPPFVRSIPIEKALDADTLVATHMNGEALTKHHGFPARALVPGWIGAASCKWLAEIKVLDEEFEGNFMNPGYGMPNTPVKPGESVKPQDTHPVTGLGVKSVISSPADGATVKAGVTKIHGVAWAGEADVTKIEISTDGGNSWNLAQFGREQARYSWRLWSYHWKAAKSGDYVIQSRASDSQDRVQPSAAVWNPSGYLYNAIDQVKIHVAA